jgi:hypothetical protein
MESSEIFAVLEPYEERLREILGVRFAEAMDPVLESSTADRLLEPRNKATDNLNVRSIFP